jgi:protein ImuB
MPHRRVLSLWFPRLAAERHLRQARGLIEAPFAVIADVANAQILVSLSETAEAAGLRLGQPLRDALAMHPALVTRQADPVAEAAFLSALRRWAGKFSPWVAEEPPESLVIDISGCAHLFGGEAELMAEAAGDCGDLGLTVRAGIADSLGAAWALARYSRRQGAPLPPTRSGDAIDQEARATRSRAARRRWSREALVPSLPPVTAPQGQIAPPGHTRTALAPLPIAALRLPEDTVAALARVGLRQVGDLMGTARAPLARRFGLQVIRRLDQALGVEPEPVSPARHDLPFAVRLTLPEPIGREEDMAAAIDRLLPALCARLAERGRGARRVRLEAHRADHGTAAIEVGLARPSAEPERIRPLLVMKLGEIDAGYGIDVIRIAAPVTEPVQTRQLAGHVEATEAALRRAESGPGIDDLIGRLGARVGLESITRLHPADSHIPEKAGRVVAAAWSEPAAGWPVPERPRPLVLFRPEPVAAPERPELPGEFRWRRRRLAVASATGPERIAPEWWLDEPDWRSGTRDYWRVETEEGARLWLFYAHGGALSPGWFCHGVFA